MKIRYLSDLHLEFTKYLPARLASVGEDVVVLCGDIGVGTAGVEWAMRAILDRPVLYVLGNHEFYGQAFERLVDECRAVAADSNVQILERDCVEIDGVTFLGATLWTDYKALGDRDRKLAMDWSEGYLADFRLIRNRDRLLVPDDVALDCADSAIWLASEIAAATDPTVVITHHSPSLANEHPEYQGSIGGGSFHNSFDHLLRPPVRLWITGHTHHSGRWEVNGIPLVSNQRGYPREGVVFDWDLVEEIG
jgi:predicted phosphodiesterase